MLEKEDLKQIENIFNQSLESRLEKILDAKFDEKLGPINKRLDGIELKIQNIEERLVNIESRLDGVETRLSKIESRMDSVEARLSSLEVEVSEIKVTLVRLSKTEEEDVMASYKDIAQLKKRVDFLESEVKRLQTARA